MVISEGGDVEVTSDEPWFKGAWFSATISKLPRKKSTKARAEVQYKSLLKDDNQTSFTEKVKLCYIRPVPPQPRSCGDDQCFEVNDVVDAFHLDGWWTGSVSKVFGDPKRYIVSFACPAEDLEFSSSDLRPHWDWVDGKWVKSPKIQLMSGFHMATDKTMEPNSVKPIRVRGKRVYTNPLRNPISSLREWTALKSTELGSNQVFAKKGCKHVNPLLKPVSDIQQWRALMAKDTKPLKADQPQGHSVSSHPSLEEFEEEKIAKKNLHGNIAFHVGSLLPKL